MVYSVDGFEKSGGIGKGWIRKHLHLKGSHMLSQYLWYVVQFLRKFKETSLWLFLYHFAVISSFCVCAVVLCFFVLIWVTSQKQMQTFTSNRGSDPGPQQSRRPFYRSWVTTVEYYCNAVCEKKLLKVFWGRCVMSKKWRLGLKNKSFKEKRSGVWS